MHLFFAAVVGLLLKVIIFRAMAALGIGIISYIGFGYLLDTFENLFLSYVTQVPPEWLSVMGYLKFDHAISLIFSAISVKFAIIQARKFVGVIPGGGTA